MRISVSDIDAWRYYMQSEDMGLDEIIARLTRREPPTEEMQAGTALHTALENAPDGVAHMLTCSGFTFDLTDIDAEIDLPELRELKAEKVYLVNGIEVTLVGKVDAIHGTRVEDHKTTARYDVERFFAGYQWRFYLDMFNANSFRWNVFVMSAVRDKPKRYWVREFHQPMQYRYPGLADDCVAELARYVAFATNYLPIPEAA